MSTAYVQAGDVIRISPGSDENGNTWWDVKLSDEGAARNLAYTQNHVGQQIAVFCDGREMSRAYIGGPAGPDLRVPRNSDRP